LLRERYSGKVAAWRVRRWQRADRSAPPSRQPPLLALPDDEQKGADVTRHAADLLGRVAMDQMHRDAKAAAAKLCRAFVQYAPNLVALDLRQARRRSTLGRRFGPGRSRRWPAGGPPPPCCAPA
jgi:hypothetical protein